MNILFVDTETTGLTKDQAITFKNIDNWPTIRQIAWLVYEKNGNIVKAKNYSTERMVIPGSEQNPGYVPPVIIPIHEILPVFLEDLSECDVIVGHNIDFDVNVILSELYRYGLETDTLKEMRRFCTMKNSIEFCGFDSDHGDRFPKLQELYSKLFHKPFSNAHDAYCDIKATADCYWKLYMDGYYDYSEYPYLISSEKKQEIAKEYVEQANLIIDNSLKDYSKNTHQASMSRMQIYSNKIRRIEAEYNSYLKKGDLNLNKIYKLAEEYQSSDPKTKEYDSIIEEENKKRVNEINKAIDLLKKAAKLGDSYSMFRIGNIYYYELKDENEANNWYKNAVENGCTDLDCYFEFASVSTRVYRERSVNGPIFFSKWADICEQQIETIPRRHLDLYIEAFEKGRYGQRKDINKAIEICRRAISLNRPEFGETEFKHGIRYELAGLLKSIGDDQGSFEQYSLYFQELNRLEEEVGSSHYCLIANRLAYFYFEGEGVNRDYFIAKQYFEIVLSFEKDNSYAAYYAGRFFEEGLADCPKDDKKAFQCFELSANGGDNRALKEVGIMYLHGIGCEKDKKKALECFTKLQGRGIDVSQYIKEAKSWFS